jgi:hypothetical protein
VNLVVVDKIQHEAVFVVVEEAYIRVVFANAGGCLCLPVAAQ